MKSRIGAILKTIAILAAALIGSYIVLYFFDAGPGNGILLGWLSTNFNSWSGLKVFFSVAFMMGVVIMVSLILLFSYLHGRKRVRRTIATVSTAMQTYMNSKGEALSLPKEYVAVENQLIQIKATQLRHEQIIKEETQQKNDLITYLAHDLKTPLASVIGYLCLLNEAPDLPAEQRAKYTGVALDKAYRLEELINEFFEITRFNLHSVVVNPGKIRLALMLEQMADEFYPILAPEHKRIAVSVPNDLVLWGDADKLARVFNNILKNAAAYSYEESCIRIEAKQMGRSVILSFTNVGDPIPPQKLDTIFEKFYRLDSARSSNTGGAGLGLAIAKEIVNAHGGSIGVQSNSERTVFTVTLPNSGN